MTGASIVAHGPSAAPLLVELAVALFATVAALSRRAAARRLRAAAHRLAPSVDFVRLRRTGSALAVRAGRRRLP
jgi:hypothetical protein